MKHTTFALLAIISLLGVTIAAAATRPQYGGDLRVEMRERVNSMDPRDWNIEDTPDQMLDLVFERLFRLDDAGKPEPALGSLYSVSDNNTVWQFQLRSGVKFHDGTPLTAAEAATVLQSEIDPAEWVITNSGNLITFNCKVARVCLADLEERLATGHTYIFHAAQNTVYGTGPFRIVQWTPQKRLQLAASENHWGGRPFVDRIDITLGVNSQQLIVDLQLRKADVIELAPNLSRRADDAVGSRVWASAPVELYAMEFNAKKTSEHSAEISRALSFAIDRSVIANALLQGRGEPAGSLLPQWLSGYSFLFPTTQDLAQAKQLRAQVSGPVQLALVYDGNDPSAGIIAERVVLNAKDAGIVVSARPLRGTAADRDADLSLARLRFSTPDPKEALHEALQRFGAAPDIDANSPQRGTPEQRYIVERTALEGGGVIPLVFVPELYLLAAQVRDWMPPRWGGWRLEDVWLESGQRTTAENSKP